MYILRPIFSFCMFDLIHLMLFQLLAVQTICNLYLFYVHWCFVCMYVCVRVPDPLELELETVLSSSVGAGN